MKQLKKLYYTMGASMTIGLMGISHTAQAGGDAAAATTTTDGSSANSIAATMTNSISQLPSLISALSYLAGVTLGTLGVLKIKDHVENPQQNPLKEGAIRLATGGALLALPTIFSAMVTAVDEGSNITQQDINAISFGSG